MSRRRHVSDEEHALWTGFARSVKPLRAIKTKLKSPAPPKKAKDAPKAAMRPGAAHSQPGRTARSPLPQQLDRRQKQRVARGRDAIDARLDLHGMTQSEAHRRLLSFLRRAQADGARFALVVTGKGTGKSAIGDERGVLKRQVPLWLALPEFRALVIGFDQAHGIHGGEGALYLRLRRLR